MSDPRGLPDLTEKVAVVTGGAKGFGAEIALELALVGAAVAIVDLNGDAAESRAAALRDIGARAAGFAADVSLVGQIEAVFGRIRDEFGAIDILVNNAGIVSSTPILSLGQDEWDRVQAVDYTSIYNCCRAVLPSMMARRSGRIINIGSVAGARGGGFLGTSAYASAKAGVSGLTAGLAQEVLAHGITVNCVGPGSMHTEMTQPLRDKPEIFQRVLGAIPLGWQGTAQHVADAVVFLASDLAARISGETLNVDGGVAMK